MEKSEGVQVEGKGTEHESPWMEVQRKCRKRIGVRAKGQIAKAWGSSVQALDLLGIGVDEQGAATFPMYDQSGIIVGQRRRPLRDITKKYSAAGGRIGILAPEWLLLGNGRDRLSNAMHSVQIIAEGESDTASVLAWGFSVIGLPGCASGHEIAVGFMLRELAPCPAVILDPDAEGQAGSAALVQKLLSAGVPCREVLLPDQHADLRAYAGSGATPEDLTALIEHTPVRYPDVWPPGFAPIPKARLRRGLIPELHRIGEQAGKGKIGLLAFALWSVVQSYESGNAPGWPERSELAKQLDASERQIDRAKDVLWRAGLLSWRPGRTARANTYTTNIGPVKDTKIVHGAAPFWRHLLAGPSGGSAATAGGRRKQR